MSIVIKGVDGSVAIMTLAPGADKEDAIRKFKEAHEGLYTDHFEAPVRALPDRQFRDAWTYNGDKIILDPTKALSIHVERVRKTRDRELEKCDQEQLRHLLDPVKIKEIEARKQKLRDLPAKVKKLQWPKELPT